MNHVVQPCGLTNTGNICYFNSLLQCILSCRYVVQHMLDSEPQNGVQRVFKQYATDIAEGGKVDYSDFSRDLLREIMQIIDKDNKYAGRQQSASEFFIILVDLLQLEWYFNHRHDVKITCKNCNNVVIKSDNAVHYECFSVIEDTTITSQKFVETFRRHVSHVDDYNCDKCKARCNATYERHAKLIPEYLVVIYNKYYGKKMINFPLNLVFNNTKKSTSLNYELISQIEHLGSLDGGHYYCISKRGDTTYTFNDRTVSRGILAPTSNTYICFYELLGNDIAGIGIA